MFYKPWIIHFKIITFVLHKFYLNQEKKRRKIVYYHG